MEAKAIGKYIGISVKKARIPANIVRGMTATDAINTLKYMQKGTAIHLRKVIESAFANATNNNKMSGNSLYISEVKIDQGPTQRRIYFKGKGGYRFFHRPSAHITVVLSDTRTPVAETKKTAKAEKAKSVKKETKKEEKSVVAKPATKTKVAKTAKKSDTKSE